jgi:hypothetical protein
MKIRTVVAVSVLLTCLLVGGPGAARAEGRLTITKATVQSCTAMGKCIWKVTCKVGGNGEAVQEMRGSSRDAKEINKSFDVQSFPVNVQCKLDFDDGWFTTSWQPVGTAELAVPGGGDYDLEMASKEKGGVTVHVMVDSLERGAVVAGAAAPAAASAKPAAKPAKAPAKAAAARQYVAVFQQSTAGEAVLVGLPWDQLLARSGQLDAKGSRIVALGTYVEGGKRLWNAIFRSGKEKQLIVPGMKWEDFSKKFSDLTMHQHMVLVDLVIYDEGTKRLVAGAFREGYDQNALWVGQAPVAFQNKWSELSGSGLRLVDLEVNPTAGGKLDYAGAFRQGSGSYGLWNGLDRDAFLAKWKKAGGGSQLNEVKTYSDGKKRLYDGVIGGGGFKSELELGIDWDTLAAKWKEQAGKGMRLVDLETYQD